MGTVSVTEQIHMMRAKLELIDLRAEKLRSVLNNSHRYHLDTFTGRPPIDMVEFSLEFDDVLARQLSEAILEADKLRQQIAGITGKHNKEGERASE